MGGKNTQLFEKVKEGQERKETQEREKTQEQ